MNLFDVICDYRHIAFKQGKNTADDHLKHLTEEFGLDPVLVPHIQKCVEPTLSEGELVFRTSFERWKENMENEDNALTE